MSPAGSFNAFRQGLFCRSQPAFTGTPYFLHKVDCAINSISLHIGGYFQAYRGSSSQAGTVATMAPASHSSDAANSYRFTGAPTPGRSAVLIPPKAAEATDPDMNLERPSLKRKDIEPSGSNRFKIVTQLIIAMKRFQGEGLL